DHHDRHVAQPIGGGLEHGEAVAVLEPDVEEHEVERSFAKPPQALFSRRHGRDLVPFVGEDLRQRLLDRLFVVDDEDAALLHAAGSAMMTGARRGRLSSTRIEPLWSAMMRDTIARPRPVPRPLVVKSGRKRRSRSRAGTPCPVSATSSVTPPSRAARRTTISPVSPQAASALSIRLVRARLIWSGSTRIAPTGRRDSTRIATPSRAPSKRRTAARARAARSVGSGCISGRRAKLQDSPPTDLQKHTSSTDTRA